MLPEHIVASIPELTIAIGLMVIIIASLTDEHGPPASGSFVAKVRIILPAAMSSADGV